MRISRECYEPIGKNYISKFGIVWNPGIEKMKFSIEVDYTFPHSARYTMRRTFENFWDLQVYHDATIQTYHLPDAPFQKEIYQHLGTQVAYLAVKIADDPPGFSNHEKAMWLKKIDQTFFQGVENLPPVYKQAIIEGYEQTLNQFMEFREKKRQEEQEEQKEAIEEQDL